MTTPVTYVEVVPLRSTPEEVRANVSIDLLEATIRELNFIRMVEANAAFLYDVKVVKNAIRRYEQCWLPLKVGNKQSSIAENYL